MRPCPECQASISDEAKTCPHCGRPVMSAAEGCSAVLKALGCILMLIFTIPFLIIWLLGTFGHR